MHNTITQGTLIYGLRSEKYPNIPCYGIIISARCDLANCKISRAYVISALNVEEWVNQIGLNLAIEELIKTKSNYLKDWSLKHNINFHIIEDFSLEEIIKNIKDKEIKIKNQDLLYKKWEEYLEYKKMLNNKAIITEHAYYKKILLKARDKLKEISNEKNTHFCYISVSEYNNTSSSKEGIIVDLLDLYQFPMELVERLEKDELDYLILKPEERISFNKSTFLEDETDFITVIGQIKSPCIEWLMQKFSFSFIRIGIDKPSDDDIDILFKKYGIED